MLLLFTVVGLAHNALLIICRLTTSLSFNVVVVYEVELVAPAAGFPLTNQLYVGPAPGLTGVAVNVTDAPAQIVPVGFADIEIEGTSTGLTVMVTLGLVTEATLGHEAPLTIVTEMTSPF